MQWLPDERLPEAASGACLHYNVVVGGKVTLVPVYSGYTQRSNIEASRNNLEKFYRKLTFWW
jgi:hypothetical protein